MEINNVGRRIVCAANRVLHTDLIVISSRHFDEFMHEQIDRYFPDAVWEQGFIDQHNTFLTRTEAWKIAATANQIIRRVGGDTANDGTLYSENLY